MSKIQIYINDEETGTYTLQEVRALLRKGTISMEDWALIDEWGDEWGAVGEIPGVMARDKIAKPAFTKRRQRRGLSPLLVMLILGFILSGLAGGLYFGVPSVRQFVNEQINPQVSSAQKLGLDEKVDPNASRSVTPTPLKPEPAPPSPVPVIKGLTKQQEAAVIKKYPYKEFPSLLDAVKNWSEVPSRLFPLKVSLVKATEFPIQPSGSIPVSVGGIAYVTYQRGNQVMLRPNLNSPYQKYVSIDDTNLKEMLTGRYNTTVNGWRRLIDKLRQDARERLVAGIPINPVHTEVSSSPQSVPSTSPPTPPNQFDPAFGKQPSVASGGKVKVVVKSIQRKELKDCQLQFIQRWGVLKKERVKGKPYWTVEVSYLVDSIFGRFPQDAKALIRNDKVEKWIIIEE
ncbi:MAG: hypothetical protein HN675_11525 [Opitutae bacterium]|nr:hypothetical protein [Opitutae bacterium]